ncbi:MAG: hypothetical protein JEZ01_11760 [Labilibaculum sp.]|nr:hypothetical protein [Labilibaculum sp.]MBI9058428.1 hypothetical protein [Labilibaculum sp.]
MDKAHFNTFIFSNADKIYYYLYCILRNSDDTVEVLTNTIEECWYERKNYEHTDLTYVFKTARKLAKAQIFKSDDLKTANSIEGCPVNSNPAMVRFCNLTEKLSPIQAEIMCLRSMVRLKLDEIAIVVELGINNVQSMLANVRKEIRAQIDPHGVLNDVTAHDIIPKYYSGKSTIEEEEQLRLYFLRRDLAGIPDMDRELFQVFLKMGNEEMPKICSEQLLLRIKEIQKPKKTSLYSRLFRK